MRSRELSYLLLGITAALSVVVRIKFLDVPLERDEGEYAYLAQRMLQGIVPFDGAYTMKYPGTPLAYAVAFLVAGQSVATIHGLLLVCNALTAAMVFLLARRTHEELTACVATSFYLLWSLMPQAFGLWTHAENVAVVPALAGWLLLSLDTRRPWLVAFCAGLLFGAAVVCKQSAMFFVLPAAVLVPRRVLLIAAGGVLPIAATIGAAWMFGVWENFWFWTVTYARNYGSGNYGQFSVVTYLFWYCYNFVSPSPLIVGTSVVGLASLYWDAESRRNCRTWCPMLLGGILAAIPGLRFVPHHFAYLIVPSSMFAALGILSLGRLAARVAPSVASWLPIAAAAMLACGVVYGQSDRWFQWSNREMSWQTFGVNAFPQSRIVGEHLRDIARTGDTLAVIGSEPHIYWQSGMRGVTGYLYVYPFMERHRWAPGMASEMTQEIEAWAPTYCVVTYSPDSWGISPQDSPLLAWWREYSAAYERVGLVSAVKDGDSVVVWGSPAAAAEPQSRIWLEVWRRKAG